GQNFGRRSVGVEFHLYSLFVGLRLYKRQRLLHQVSKVDRLEGKPRRTAVVQQVAQHSIQSRDLILYRPEHAVELRALVLVLRGVLVGYVVYREVDDVQRIAYLVGVCLSYAADNRGALALVQPIFELAF